MAMNLTTPSAYRFVTGDDLGKIVLDGQVKPLRGDSSIRGEDLTVLYEQAGQLYQILNLGTKDANIPKLEFSRKITAEQVGKVVDMCLDQWKNLHPQGSNDEGHMIGFADDAYDPDGRCAIWTGLPISVVFANVAFGEGKWWKPDSYVLRFGPAADSSIDSYLIDSLYEDSRKFKHVARIGRKTNYFDIKWHSPTVLEQLAGDAPTDILGNGIHYLHSVSGDGKVLRVWYGSPSATESIGGFFDVNCTNVKLYALFHVSVSSSEGGDSESHCYFVRKMGLTMTWQELRTSALAAMNTLGIEFPVLSSSKPGVATVDVSLLEIMATGDLTHTDWWNWSKVSQ